MKNTTFILLLALSFSLHAQNYTFSNLTGTYADLTGTTSLNNGEIWDEEEYDLILPFALTINGNTSAALTVVNGSAVKLLSTNDISYYAVPFGADLEDRGSNGSTSLSPISYKIDGVTGSRIVKIECKNCGSWTDTNKTMFVNFQMWFYEGSNIIEYRYGSSLVNDTDVFYDTATGAVIGIANEDMDFNLTNTHLLTGAATNPNLSIINTAVNVTGTPDSNRIFRFAPANLNTTDVTKLNVSTYPNPFTDFVAVEGLKESYNYSIFDVSGKLVHSSENNLATDRIDTKSVTAGIYLLKIISGNETITKKIIKI